MNTKPLPTNRLARAFGTGASILLLLSISLPGNVHAAAIGVGVYEPVHLCKGIPAITMACAASVAGTTTGCVPVTGSIYGFNFDTELCADVGGAACVSATGSLLHEIQACAASAEKYTYNSHQECERAYNDLTGESYWVCHTVADPSSVDPVFDNCSSYNAWIYHNVAQVLAGGEAEIPGWHLVICASGASQVGGSCIHAEATASAHADYVADDHGDAATPSCDPDGASEDGGEVAADALSTSIEQENNFRQASNRQFEDGATCELLGMGCLLPSDLGGQAIRISQFDATTQEQLRNVLRTSYLNQIEEQLSNIMWSDPEVTNAIRDALRTSVTNDLEQTLSTDFEVEWSLA